MTEKEYKAQVKRELIKRGKVPIKAKYDRFGNCDLCGECGRCPGWHYKGEDLPRLSENLANQRYQGIEDARRGLYARSANGTYLDGFYGVKR